MKLLKRILAAVDFDGSEECVLKAAGTLAKQFGSEVALLHAIESAPHAVGAAAYREVMASRGRSRPVLATSGGASKLKSVIREGLEELRGELTRDSVSVPTVLCAEGKAFVEIIAAAERLDANVIVLAARRATTAQPFALGVTTEKVMRKSAKPVLAVPPDRPLRLKRIVCAVDFSDASARGLANAIRLARAFSGKLRIITVTSPPAAYARLSPQSSISAATPEEAEASNPVEEFSHFLEQFDLRDVDWEQRVEHGEPAVEIIRSARDWDANLIVIGSTGRTGLARILMGSTALKVARQLPCALLTVKREAVLIAELEQNIADIQAAYEDGRELLRQGFYEQAIERFQQCLRLNAYFPPALDASAEAHDRLRQVDQAEQCRRQAALIRDQLWIRDSV